MRTQYFAEAKRLKKWNIVGLSLIVLTVGFLLHTSVSNHIGKSNDVAPGQSEASQGSYNIKFSELRRVNPDAEGAKNGWLTNADDDWLTSADDGEEEELKIPDNKPSFK